MAKYLVTGGAGFIGSNIVEHLAGIGETVHIIDNFTTGKRENIAPYEGKITVFDGSLLDEKVLNAAVQGVDYVLHQAALPSVQRSVEAPVVSNEINVTGTVKLLEAAKNAGVKRVVYAASSSAYGDQPVSVKTESLLPMPKSPYAVAKLTGEYYMKAFSECFDIETVCLRYFNVFGPRQDPNSEYSAVIPRFLARVLKGERPTIYGDGLQSRDFTFVENNVIANVLAATTPGVSGKVFNIACGRSYSLLDVLAEINKVLGTNAEPEFAPARSGDVKHSLADISAVQAALGYQVTVDFETGLRKAIDYYKSIFKA